LFSNLKCILFMFKIKLKTENKFLFLVSFLTENKFTDRYDDIQDVNSEKITITTLNATKDL
jgi:hypothetical protein